MTKETLCCETLFMEQWWLNKVEKNLFQCEFKHLTWTHNQRRNTNTYFTCWHTELHKHSMHVTTQHLSAASPSSYFLHNATVFCTFPLHCLVSVSSCSAWCCTVLSCFIAVFAHYSVMCHMKHQGLWGTLSPFTLYCNTAWLKWHLSASDPITDPRLCSLLNRHTHSVTVILD